jgi:hypothetical protein
LVAVLEDSVVVPAGVLVVVLVAESVVLFLPWSPVTVVLLESVCVDTWANIEAAVINDTKIRVFMPLTGARTWPKATLRAV